MTRIMISGGGTGGGVYPALSATAALKKLQPGVELLWVGSESGPERALVERAGLPFKMVYSGPIAGVGLKAVRSVFLILSGIWQALGLVRAFRPDALLVTGGWVTVPATIACWLSGVPIAIYLPDTEPGATIKALGRMAARVAVNSSESAAYFQPEQVIETGYPLRPALLQAAGYDVLGQPLTDWDGGEMEERARARFGLSTKAPVLLVFGGSRGARSINTALLPLVDGLVHPEGDYPGCEIIHISGTLDHDQVREQAGQLPKGAAARYHLVDYLHTEDMALAMAAADLVVSRAGAGTLGEFPLFDLPAILVPYPHAWRYQKVNADVMAARGAAIRLDDKRLADDLAPLVRRVLSDPGERARMAQAMGQLKRPDAAARIAAMLAGLADT